MDEHLTCLDRVVLLLSETHPAVAAGVRAAGSNARGDALPGLLGWMRLDEVTAMCKAILLVHAGRTDCKGEYVGPLDEMVEGVMALGAWRHPNECDHPRITDALFAWGEVILNQSDPDEPADFEARRQLVDALRVLRSSV